MQSVETLKAELDALRSLLGLGKATGYLNCREISDLYVRSNSNQNNLGIPGLFPRLLLQRAATIGRRNMCFQKLRCALVSINLILNFREAMPLIFIDLVLHYAAALLNCIDHLLRFFVRTAWIIPACEQQQRSFYLIYKVDR